MSHIETGNTKLSLPVLVDLASALEVDTDDLLVDSTIDTRQTVMSELEDTLNGCSVQQAKVLKDIVKAAKTSMEKHL